MNEDGKINRGVTQEVRRPLAAVSSLTENDKMVFFCSGDDWIIDRQDKLADQILQLVRRATKKDENARAQRNLSSQGVDAASKEGR